MKESGYNRDDISFESGLGWDREILQHLHNHISLRSAFSRSQHCYKYNQLKFKRAIVNGGSDIIQQKVHKFNS